MTRAAWFLIAWGAAIGFAIGMIVCGFLRHSLHNADVNHPGTIKAKDWTKLTYAAQDGKCSAEILFRGEIDYFYMQAEKTRVFDEYINGEQMRTPTPEPQLHMMGDPSAPNDGDIWTNSHTGKIMAHLNGRTFEVRECP